MDAEATSVETLTLTRRLLRTRGVAIYFLLVLAAPLIGVKAVHELWAWASRPSLGIPVDAELRVFVVPGVWPGIENGDRIVAVDGHAVATLDDLAAAERAGAERVTVRFARGAQELDVTGVKTQPSWPLAVAAAVRCATGLVVIAIGLGVFLLRPGTRVTWLFLLTCYALGLALVALFVFHANIVTRTIAVYSAVAVAASLGVHLFAELPRRLALLARRPRLAILPYVPAVLLVAGYALAGKSARADSVSLAITVWTGVACLLVLALGIEQRRTAVRDGDHSARTQTGALLAAMIVGMLVPAILAIAFQLRLIEVVGMQHYLTAPCVFYAGFVGYTAVRHNAFDIDRFTAAIAGYAAMLVLIGAAFALALVALPLVLGTLGVSRSPELYVALTAIVFVACVPIYGRVRRAVDRLFQRSTLDAGRQADVLRELGTAVQNDGRDRGLDSALDAAMVMTADRAALWLLDEGGHAFRRDRSVGAELEATLISRHGALGRELATSDTARGVHGLADVTLPSDAEIELWREQLALVAPIRLHGALAGFVAVGRKLSGVAYDLAEGSFLSAVAMQIGIALDRASQDSTRLGRYRLGKRLGVGGMAEVYLAWQTGPGGFERKVAIKRPLPSLMEDPAGVAMFLDEARIAAQLAHRNIVGVVEIDKYEGTYFIAMEYVDGPSVRAVIKTSAERGVTIPLPIAAHLGAEILGALAYAHAATDAQGAPLGLIHRDVTPANVLLSLRGEVKLGDFGVARAAARLATTLTGGIKGTAAYMSPEQAAGGVLDGRSDLYAAGATLYELVTGDRAHPEGPRPGLARALDAFFARAMALRADDRPATADAMKAEWLAAIGAPASEEEVASWVRELQQPAPDPQAPITGATAPDRKR